MDTTPTIFTKAGCPHCEEGRQFLRSEGVAFYERNVSVDSKALMDLLFMLGRCEVPVLCSGYHAVIGFDPDGWRDVVAHGRSLGSRDPLALAPMFGDDPMGD
jgi:glutaredoxin